MSDAVAMEITEDLVNRPTHYTHSNIECISAIEASMSVAQFKGFLKGQVMSIREIHSRTLKKPSGI